MRFREGQKVWYRGGAHSPRPSEVVEVLEDEGGEYDRVAILHPDGSESLVERHLLRELRCSS